MRAFGLVPGLGSHVSWRERLDGVLGQAILSIQAVKGAAVGDGIEVAGLPGSKAHDEIFYDDERGFYRQTNRAGGVEGGMTTGDPLVVRGYMKPLPTLTKPLRSVDIATHEPPRRCASAPLVHRPRRRRRGGGDGRLRARRRLPAQVRGRPHRRRHRRAGRLPGAHRLAAAVSVPTRDIVLVGSSQRHLQAAADGIRDWGRRGVRSSRTPPRSPTPAR